ncbi:MAG TPA: VOC family protein [Thermomicrobiales bacterium]|nr:VOC family protein [Thermomicrobiales bacterium]
MSGDRIPVETERQVARMEPRYFVLHVASIETSIALYTDLLGTTPQRPSPTFAAFPLGSGVMLELWQRSGIEPASVAPGGAVDITFTAGSREELERIHGEWRDRGLHILLDPVEKVFGYTFVAADPDGHRLRVIFNPAEQGSGS